MNRNIRTLSILALAIAGAAPAWATFCDPGTAHAGQPEPYWPNRCNEGAAPAGSTSKATGVGVGVGIAGASASSLSHATGGRATATGGSARQQQRQAQQQQQALRSEQNTTVTGAGQGAGAYAGAGAGAGAGFNGDINISAGSGNSGGGSRTIIPAPIYAGPGVAPLPAGAMIQFFRPCGSLQMVIQRAVKGRETNTGRDSTEFDHTWTDVVLDATDGNGKPTPFWKDEDGTLWGTEYYVVSWTISAGIDGAFSAQVFGQKGGGGLGGNAGIAIQVPVQRVIASMCKLPVAPVPPRTVFVEVPRKNGRK